MNTGGLAVTCGGDLWSISARGKISKYPQVCTHGKKRDNDTTLPLISEWKRSHCCGAVGFLCRNKTKHRFYCISVHLNCLDLGNMKYKLILTSNVVYISVQCGITDRWQPTAGCRFIFDELKPKLRPWTFRSVSGRSFHYHGNMQTSDRYQFPLRDLDISGQMSSWSVWSSSWCR